MSGVVFKVSLHNRPRGEVRNVFRKWPIGELIELPLHLNAEVRITDGPHTAKDGAALVHCAVKTLSEQELGSGKIP